MSLLFGLMQRLTQQRKHLEVCFGNTTLLQTYQHLPFSPSKKADNDFSANRLHLANGKAYSQAYNQNRGLKY